MHRGLFLAVIVSFLAPRGRAEGPENGQLPQPEPGWKIDLTVQGPQIAGPTALIAAPDETVYIGQSNRIVAFKDGKLSVFADTLGHVHGLEWLDGTLFVAHGSCLSVISAAGGRADLVTGLEPKLLGAAPSDEACVGGIRLGLDGYLYMAVGERGIPRALGRDGRTIAVRGGGVIRVRPDGTGLEVVSTGERNPHSVAVSATGEIFTFGSADPGNRWPGGLTHHIEEGHFGYPYQFLTAPFRALPVMGGEATREAGQGICSSDDRLPARYHGNLFFCDPAMQCVARFELRKAGGTYAIARRSAVVTRGNVDDFHPVALTATGDGSGFWIVDREGGPTWPGRLYRLTCAGADRASRVPEPAGDAIARSIAALDQPAFSVRLAAQRALAKQGNTAAPALIARLRTAEPETGRLHALWALDGIGSVEARQVIREALRDPSVQLRLQAARSCGIRADRVAVNPLSALLADHAAAVRREAAIALGRCGDNRAIAPLLAALGDSDRFAAWSIRSAIRRLGCPTRETMTAALVDPRRRESALILADESWSLPVVQALVDALKQTPEPAIRGRIVACLAGEYRRYPEWTGDWWGPSPLTGPFPKKTRDWSPEGMRTVLDGLGQGLADRDATVRFQSIVALGQIGPTAVPVLLAGLGSEPDPGNQAQIVEALGETNDPRALQQLTPVVTDAKRSVSVRAAALDALARFRGPDILNARLTLLYDPKAPEELVARALPSLARDGFLPLNDLAGFLESPSAVVRAAALLSLNVKKAPPPEIRQLVLARLDDVSPEVRQAAMLAAGALQLREAVPKLLEIAGNPDAELRTQAVAALCRMPDRRAVAVYHQAGADADPSLRRAAARALQAIGGKEDAALVRTGDSRPRDSDTAARARFALNHPGDPRAGELLFFENRQLACGRCHAAGERGQGTRGPDLSGLGSRMVKARIIHGLLEPTEKVAAAHQPVQAGLQSITPLQLADLVSFLEGLKQGPPGR